ncbi:hypothetical protein [Faecalispora jeddahensis]|uniref:hypothetical protein n=1 Tax=Faecalispora jeddahensis TaxID=1414721 RepID=UPI00189A5F1F|nr:hypothetical protein [Faecalispora jeddahensis]
MKFQHENSHIEIINKSLWSVRFSLIPLIPQISWKPDPNVPLEDMPGQISPSGIIVLNKDFKFYQLLRRGLLAVMKLNPRQLNKEISLNPLDSAKSGKQLIYWMCLNMEDERRKIKKGGVHSGNDQNRNSPL